MKTKEKKNPTRLSARKTTKSQKPKATAFHAELKDGTSVVGIGDLRVVITRDAGQWFAQGLEIDYAAQGTSIKDVKRQFEDGLCSTIHEHLRKFNSIQKLLQPAPTEVWKEMFYDNWGALRLYSQISSHCLTEDLPESSARSFPFEQIQFLGPQQLQAA